MATEMITVRMSRSDPSIIWGFRLQGGKEFHSPLTISKVVPGSLAERAGLVEGDYVVRIGGRAVDQMQHRDAQDAIVASANDVELFTCMLPLPVFRTGSRIWKPTIRTTSDHFSPVKYSLAHHEDMLQDDSLADSGFRSFSSGGGTPGDTRLTYGSQMDSSFGSTGRRVEPSYQSPQKPIKTADSYLRETGGLFGTDPSLQKTEQPSFLHSETLRLIRETEGRDQEHGRGHPSVEPIKQGPRGAEFGEGQRMARTTGAPECYSCGRQIFGVFCKVSDNNYHSDCFKCSTCGTSLKNVGHYLLNGKLYCDIHARQQQQDLFRATAPQDPSIFSFRGAPPQPSPKHAEPPKAFYQPEVLKPASSPIPHVHSAPLSPSSRGIPTHQVSKMPGSCLREIHQEMEMNRPPPPPSSYTSSRGGQAFQEAHSGKCIVGCRLLRGIRADAELTIDQDWSEAGTPIDTPLSLVSASDLRKKIDVCSRLTSDASLDLEPCNEMAIAREVICANLTFYRTAEAAEANGRTVGSYMPRRGRGILKQIGDTSRIPVCEACMREIRGPFVLALSKTWCPDHFTCSHPDCQRKLLDVGFVEEAGFIYCEFCFEKYLAPTCNKCQRAIVGDTLTAMERKWHPECFCCAHCHQPFGNSCFFLEEGKPFCEKDWNALFTTKCSACQFPIEAGDRWVEALGNAYHSNCFNCTICQRSLEGQNFYLKGGHPYCKAHA
ncbi:PDZ and LIM domain containing protein [Trichuris trichiura]|uniref:PDZ and LIM domain containing protein n=1 Tax=Trichuris trichiura TaxID=36087 RepID=A0A077YXN5_TRITR|nr:PDZ and LIM domain containing protein [Trichuris trichiura]